MDNKKIIKSMRKEQLVEVWWFVGIMVSELIIGLILYKNCLIFDMFVATLIFLLGVIHGLMVFIIK